VDLFISVIFVSMYKIFNKLYL